jgi:hypothetical protein
MMNQESKRPVTIEDLLRLKRAEHPKAEFWTEFDRELRAKQLAALVEKRPWWRALPHTFRGLTRYSLPLGATAVLAITFLSVRDYHPGISSQPHPLITGTIAPTSSVARSNTDASRGIAVADDEAVRVADASTTPAGKSFSSDANAPGELARMVPMLSGDEATANAEDIRPSARSIAENLAAAEVMLGSPQPGFEARALPTRSSPREPLAEMPNPSETRRSRFAAAFASMTSEASPAPSARVARRLSDEQLYDSIHRFGASGNSVSFKF